ncbi:anaphase-promoting complex subunit 13 [Toxorhynchites rutilus septentrionalis]|uniref:anaphase-promoting complex subunit 13 n=1 Tax=Toxorhynchites rutilus septentrionalis TaxID=329112 RepID=UPI002478B810|nr:anaphase-promoting complex subunit 13 [Toxorhynchites rutilus septentrionalis]
MFNFQPISDGYLIDLVDNEWLTDELPNDQIIVPSEKLPDPEADNGDSHLTLKEQEQKWTDLALSTLVPEICISEQLNINGV